MIMVHPKLRRVLASSALVSSLALVPMGNAHAAVHAPAHKGHAGAASLWDLLVETLEKAGIRIDPDGQH
jgi:hypothetical protein